MSARIKYTGRQLAVMTAQALASSIEGLALEVERQVKVERAPVDSGELRGGVHTEHRRQGLKVVSPVSTGEGQEYAAVQHENEWFTHPRGGEPKYMRNALEAVGLKVEETVAGAIRAKLN